MKLRNKILAMAVVAVAGISGYNANNTNSAKLSDLQIENIEMVAEAWHESAYGYYCRYNDYFNFCYNKNNGSACPTYECE